MSNHTAHLPPGGSAQRHPRRPPANQSVSLLKSPRSYRLQAAPQAEDSSSHDSNEAQRRTTLGGKPSSNSPSSLTPQAGKHSSGESSNAETWFDKSNNKIHDASNSYADNDSPFFLRNSSSSEEHIDKHLAAQRQYLTDRAGSLPVRTGLLHLGTDGSSTEDFRGVIDDLTIENKKLKRRLKKYEKLNDSHLKDEKLFEVRIHGLPAHKKRELEETLRKFATDLHGARGGTEFPANGYLGLSALLQTHKSASSSTSLQNTDSAYASMSASGQGSSTSGARNKASAQSAKSRHQNIHTYLHHIPEGLLPDSNPATMTERAKKKLVVRRLEQIFAGKGAATGGHQQALQQQDVSHMAARADRKARESEGQHAGQEGIREAHMMHKDAEELASEAAATAEGNAPATSVKKPTIEQRPTRPLDLDPHRAQIPADNLRYIRHLGFTLPESESLSPEDDQGWVYSNLLINMAQLHNLNVTSDFVRKAVNEHSAKLEMCDDGRKLRWKGGRSITRTSSYGGDSTRGQTDDEAASQSPRKRVKLSRMDSDREANRVAQKQGIASSSQSHENRRFAYTPLFFHNDSTGDEGSSSSETDEDDAMSSDFPPIIGGNSSGMTSSGIRTTSTKQKKKHDDGPIIFYNNARFCTDLSGDNKPADALTGPVYKQYTSTPLGKPEKIRVEPRYFEKRGPLAEAVKLPESMDLANNPIPETLELAFPRSSPSVSPKDSERAPVNFEVTGIGGIYPADNFAIAVESRHVLAGAQRKPTMHAKNLPSKIARILRGITHDDDNDDDAHLAAGKQILSTRRKQLQPSALPPALSYMQYDSMSDDDSDADDGMSVSPESPGAMARAVAPQPMDIPYSSLDDSDIRMDIDEAESDDSSDDGSLDLLAAAREADPEAVRAREREYDANMAERLAEEIPAGSSAATAGGGSGFASPSNGVSPAAYQRAMREARSHKIPRMPTNDSMALNARSSMEESEEAEQQSISS